MDDCLFTEQSASIFVCGLSRTCTEHFTDDSFEQILSCYTCQQDYCNAFIDVPLEYTSSRSLYLSKYLILVGYLLNLFHGFSLR